jgi:hypothetical protein
LNLDSEGNLVGKISMSKSNIPSKECSDTNYNILSIDSHKSVEDFVAYALALLLSHNLPITDIIKSTDSSINMSSSNKLALNYLEKGEANLFIKEALTDELYKSFSSVCNLNFKEEEKTEIKGKLSLRSHKSAEKPSKTNIEENKKASVEPTLTKNSYKVKLENKPSKDDLPTTGLKKLVNFLYKKTEPDIVKDNYTIKPGQKPTKEDLVFIQMRKFIELDEEDYENDQVFFKALKDGTLASKLTEEVFQKNEARLKEYDEVINNLEKLDNFNETLGKKEKVINSNSNKILKVENLKVESSVKNSEDNFITKKLCETIGNLIANKRDLEKIGNLNFVQEITANQKVTINSIDHQLTEPKKFIKES